MAGKAKSIYLTVSTHKEPHKAVFRKMFFDAKSLKEYTSTDEFKAKYPLTEYQLYKETY